MSDADSHQRNVFRVTHLNRALGNDNFCSKVDPLLAPSSQTTPVKIISMKLQLFLYIYLW
jgi:hypothetical protein